MGGVEAQKVLAVLSEESRWRIVRILMASSVALTLSEVAERVGRDKRTVDKHLKALMEVGLVERRLGEENVYVYRATPTAVMIVEAVEKILAGAEPPPSPAVQGGGDKFVEVVSKSYGRIVHVLPSAFLLLLGVLVGYGDKLLGIGVPGSPGVRLLGMVFLFFLAAIAYGLLRRWVA